MDVRQYNVSSAFGTRLYFIKDKPEDLPKARACYRRLKIIDKISKTLISLWFINMILKYIDNKFF